jgi:uncharacterized integral membrane protein
MNTKKLPRWLGQIPAYIVLLLAALIGAVYVAWTRRHS